MENAHHVHKVPTRTIQSIALCYQQGQELIADHIDRRLSQSMNGVVLHSLNGRIKLAFPFDLRLVPVQLIDHASRIMPRPLASVT